jgi:hypothetical protein
MTSRSCCTNPSCRAPIPRWKRFCDACWRLLPAAQRSALVAAQKAGRFTQLDSLAIEAGDWLRDHNPAAAAARRLVEGEA